jgi:hypothetical protein
VAYWSLFYRLLKKILDITGGSVNADDWMKVD